MLHGNGYAVKHTLTNRMESSTFGRALSTKLLGTALTIDSLFYQKSATCLACATPGHMFYLSRSALNVISFRL